MSTIIVTGSAGLIGAETVRFFSTRGFRVVGIDNDMRRTFFGNDASTDWSRRELEATIPNYVHESVDIRDQAGIEDIFRRHADDLELVVHTAAQPSHDWAAKDPYIDFSVNSLGTLVMLESTRKFAPQATFIFTSTNKVYGERPNLLPLVEHETRWEVDAAHAYFKHGIDEQMSVDQTKHSLFGASKLAADTMVQEYGRYFGMNTGCFRCGCLSGPGHSGTMLHGFLSYLVKCAFSGEHYTILGYQGKQVRDNLHAYDLVNMFWHFHRRPRPGEVYNVGGGRHSNCSILEAIALSEELIGLKMKFSYSATNRIGDHIWYISDTRKYQNHYPDWSYRYDLRNIMKEIVAAYSQQLKDPVKRATVIVP